MNYYIISGGDGDVYCRKYKSKDALLKEITADYDDTTNVHVYLDGAEITNIDCIRRYGEVCFKISDAEEALI